MTTSLERAVRPLALISALLLVVAWLVHGWWVWTHAVNVPFHDDWALVPPETGLASWLLERHNEHRLLVTRLVIASLYALTDWDVAVHQRLNWILFSVELLLLGVLLATVRPRTGEPRKTSPPGLGSSRALLFTAAFLLFAVSTLPKANHVWAVQTVVHVLVITLAMGLLGLFDPGQRPSRIFAGSAALLLLPWTLASGAVAALAVTAVWWLWRLRRGFPTPVVAVGPIVALLGAGLMMTSAALRPRDALTAPWDREFWVFFANLAGLGWGYSRETTELGLFFLVLALLPVPLLLLRNWREPKVEAARWLAFAGSVVAVLAAMASGRTGLGLELSKAPRYAEVAVLLPLATASGWCLVLSTRVQRLLLLGSLWLLAAVGYANDWNFGVYSDIARHRWNGVDCAVAYWRGFGDGRCEPLFSPRRFDVAPKLLADAAQRRISIWRQVAEPRPRSGPADPSDFRGAIDGVEGGPRQLLVVGWALPSREPGGTGIVLRHRDREIATGRPSLSRKDVAKALALPDEAELGFRLHVPRARLPALSADGVEAWVRAGDRMEPLRVSWQLPSSQLLAASDGRRLPVIPGELHGRWQTTADGIAGWAGDLETGRPASEILLLVDGRVVPLGSPSLVRPAVASTHGASLRNSGFRYRLEDSLRARPRRDLRVLAISDRGVASSLPRQ